MQLLHSGFLRKVKYSLVAFVIVGFAAVIPTLLLKPSTASAAIPTKMNFQGRLTDSSGVTMPDGLYNMRFRIFDAASAGTQLWTELRETTNRVQVTSGLFSVQLGDVTALSASIFNNASTLYFEIELPSTGTATCSTASCATWSEGAMTPRSVVSTSAYAFNADTLDGIDSAAFAQLSANNTWSGNNVFNGTLQGSSSLTLGTASTSSGTIVLKNDTNANTVTLQTGTTGTSYSLTLPTATGSTGQCLYSTDNASTLGWTGCGGSGANTALSNIASTNLSAPLNVDSGNLTLQTTTSGNLVLNAAGTTELQDDTNVGGNLALAAGKSLTLAGGATGTRPGGAACTTEGMLYYDTTTDQLLTCSATGGKWQADGKEAILVAASDSSDADKAAADYVADGNTAAAGDGDQVQINDALTAASASGTRKTGRVVLLAGTYVADDTILVANNTTLSGVGRGTLIELADLDVTKNLIENLDTAAGTGVTIRDMRINGRKDLNTAGTQNGIYFSGMGSGVGARQGGQVLNVYANDFRHAGIYLNASNNNTLIGNTAQGNNAYGINLFSSSNNTLSGNTTQSGLYGFALTDSSSYNTLSGNTVQGNSNVGITLTTNSSTNNLTGNTITGNLHGVYLSASSSNTITGNTVQGNSQYGIALSNVSTKNTVSSNNIDDNGGATDNNGIHVNASDYNTITSNTITDTACTGTTTCYAINVFNSTSDKNYLEANRFSGSATIAASINDAGTGTIYAGQQTGSTTSANSDVSDFRFRGSAGSTTGFAIQSATGTNILNVNTTNGDLQLGSYNAGTNPLAGKIVLANASNTNTVSLLTGTTSTSYSLTLPTAVGSTGQCISATDNAGTLGWGACSGGGGINNATTTQTANFNIQSANAASVTALIQGAASQSVNIFEVKDSANETPFSVGSTGQVSVSKQLFTVTGTTTNSRKVHIQGNVNSGAATQYGLDNQVFFQPTGAVSDIFGLNNSVGLASSSQNVTRLFGSITGIQTLGGGNNYSGTITNGTGLQVSGPSIAGTNKIPTYLGININPVTNASNGNSGNTSGNIINTQLQIGGNTAAAGGSGVLYNTGAKIIQPSGSGAGTTHNTGLSILDSNTGVTGSWSLYNGSAQSSHFNGNVLVGTTTNTNGYKLNVADILGVDTSASRIVIGTSNTTGTTLVLDTKTGAGDPTGVDGAMYYNLDSKSFRCYKNGLWQDCNFSSLRSEWMLQEEWRNANATIASTNTMGDNNWTSASIGTGGTLTRVNVGTDASNRDRWGVMQMNSPATVSTGAHLRQEQIGMTGVPTNMTVEFDFAPVNAAAAAGLQQHARIGLHDATNNTTAPVDGIYFQYSATTAAANWFRCTRNANSETCTDTGVARTLTANQYQRFKFVTNSDGTSVEFFINESSVGSNTTNLPAAAAAYGPAINVYTVDATIRQWKTDYYQIKRNLTTLR